MKTKALTILLLTIVNSAISYNILAIFPYNGKSHFIVFRVFLQELVNRGHNVTVISHFPEENPLDNYHDISLAGTLKPLEGEWVPLDRNYFSILMTGYYLASTGVENCDVMLENKEVQDLVKSKQKFDVILVEQFNSDCALGIVYKLGAPVVGTSSHIPMPYHYNRFGMPNNPSFVSFHFTEGGTKPNFVQRLERVILDWCFKSIFYWYTQRTNQNSLAKYFKDVPPLEDLAREIKFYLVYQNFVFTSSKLLPANVIEVQGYHVPKAKALTGKLKNFVDDAKHGIIYISFGSVVKSASLSSDKVQIILDSIKEFPQRFIWKWENGSLGAEDKVYVQSWVPQVDILGHPKTVAFISHAGMGGSTEALHFGVPMIAMPILGDQPSNAAAVEESGLGVQLQFGDLTKDNLVAALRKVLDPKFKTQAKELSSAWHDRPSSALDTAVFWTEFTARHPSLSFRTRAADVPLYQYLCLDVYGVLVGSLLVICALLKMCCCRRSHHTNVKEDRKSKKKSKRE